MNDQNNIFKAIENFVSDGNIASSESHVDFNTLKGNIVTWSLSDDPVPATTPSLYIRRINDVRQILRLQKQRENHSEKIRKVKVQMAKVNNSELVTITPDIAELFKMIDQL